MDNSARKAFVGVKSYYYKSKAAAAVLDHAHALRNGFTKSANVFTEKTQDNRGHYFHGATSCSEALEMMCLKHKEVTGKKVRSDNNVLFEHVVFLSEFRYSQLEKKYGEERVKQNVMRRLIDYAYLVKKELNFEPLGVELHLDEGRYENGKFIRNVHAHVQFMNYSFDKRIAPLRHMMKKGKDAKGRTNSSNPNFAKLQDLAHMPFANLGFLRGEQKNVTGREHLTKEDFVKRKLTKLKEETGHLSQRQHELNKVFAENTQQARELSDEIEKKAAQLTWLEKQVANLNAVKEELSKALIQKSAQALQMLVKKTASLTANNALRKNRR